MLTEGKGEPFSREDIQRLCSFQRVFAGSTRSLANDYRIPPSQRHGEAPPKMAVAGHCHASECHHLGRDYRRPSTPPPCGPRPCSVRRLALRCGHRPGWSQITCRPATHLAEPSSTVAYGHGSPTHLRQPGRRAALGDISNWCRTWNQCARAAKLPTRPNLELYIRIARGAGLIQSFTAALIGSHTNVLKKRWRIRMAMPTRMQQGHRQSRKPGNKSR